jgi:hypothetical protein
MVDIDTESLGLYLPAIDPRNEEELAKQGQLVVFNRSSGLLNDFSDHNPLAALLQGQAFSGAELLYYASKLPLALVVKFLEVTGSTRKLGTKATATLTFTLTASLSSAFQILAGFEITNRAGDRRFTTDSDLIIPAGQPSGTVNATAIEAGAGYNLPAYTITVFTQPLAFLASVVNIEASQGGAAAQTVEEAIAQALTAARRRSIVTADDYQDAAAELLGSGARVKAIGLLGADALSYQLGAVHLFCLDSAGDPTNSAQNDLVFNTLLARIQIGTALYVSPMPLLYVSGAIVAKLLSGNDPELVGDRLWTAFDGYLNRHEPGETLLIGEVVHELRFVGGLEAIDLFNLQELNSNVEMPNNRTLPRAYSLDVRLVSDTGDVFSFLRGEGEPVDFSP